MELYFVTSNISKYGEVKAIFEKICPNVTLKRIDYSKDICKHKCIETYNHLRKNKCIPDNSYIIVDDTALSFIAWNGLPGPYIKYFLTAKPEGEFYTLLDNEDNKNATAETCIGLYNGKNDIKLFIGKVEGKIVKPTILKWNFDSYFMPFGHTKTYAEMAEEKDLVSQRYIAITNCINYIKTELCTT